MATDKPRRNTRQRQVILEELRKFASHPTAAELYEVTRRRLPRISLGTVYRNLELLSRLGKINKIKIAGSETRFDSDLGGHRHVRCVDCGRVDDIHGLPADLVSNEVEHLTAYNILGHRLEFVGVCPECIAKSLDGVNEETPPGSI
jgi:Fur family ferric uptake transcriptional regulator